MTPDPSIARPEFYRAVWTHDARWLQEHVDAPGMDELDRALCSAWSALFDGRFESAVTAATRVEGEAREARAPAQVVMAASLVAWGSASLGDLEAATSHARRASRMGRVEGIFDPECIAHAVLARVRRLSGYPHLAARIVGALVQHVPHDRQGWLDWERTMAGVYVPGPQPEPPASASPIDRAAHLLRRVVRAAREGRPEACRAALASLLESPLPALGQEARGLAAVLDTRRAEALVDAWCHGEEMETPGALSGVVHHRPEDSTDSARCYVWASPGMRGRRIAPLGLSLLPQPFVQLPQTRARQGRNESIVAALALAGADGLSEGELFESVFEFAYRAEQHRGSLAVTLHRARKYAERVGQVELREQRVWLNPTAAFVVPDPRGRDLLSDRLLCAIADRREACPADLADGLQISLRVARGRLAALQEQGSCVVERRGRQLVYRVEDTTFSDTTMLRRA
ncbi:MAG: hypothetical protein AB8I08_15250 [Sandaracinaceae bacterium]